VRSRTPLACHSLRSSSGGSRTKSQRQCRPRRGMQLRKQ
jgi:hypothetical protein